MPHHASSRSQLSCMKSAWYMTSTKRTRAAHTLLEDLVWEGQICCDGMGKYQGQHVQPASHISSDVWTLCEVRGRPTITRKVCCSRHGPHSLLHLICGGCLSES